MKYTGEAAVLVPDFAARWRARRSILANNIQRSNKEKMHEKGKTTRLRPRKTPQHISTQNQLKTLKLSTILIKQ
jgi:hypothetical protein